MKNKSKPRLVTLFECIKTIHQLELLKDLIRHDRRWAHQIDLARPLKKLGIDPKNKHKHQLIRQKINNLLPIAGRAAQLVGIPTTIESKERDFPDTMKFKDVEYGIFMHYEILMSKDKPFAHNFDLVLSIIDQTIGVWKDLRFKRIIDFPIWIISWILRLPITILEYMGFDTESNIAKTVLSIIIRIIWILFLALLLVIFGEESEAIKTLIDLIKK